MSENLNVNGYSCSSSGVYNIVKNANLTSSELKMLDKNSDKKISEDELAEFIDLENETTTERQYSDNPTIASLEFQYDQEQSNIEKYQKRISDLMRLKNKTNVNIASVSDTETIDSLTSKLSSIQGQIDEYNSKINDSLNNMNSISAAIIQVQMQIENGISSNGYANTGVLGATAGSGTSSTISVQSGSGQALTSVTGEMSTCLDNVAKSLGTTRETAADYITTLCNTIGKGYFDPEVILSQILSESSGNQSCTTTANAKCVGLGQMSAVAVEEINKQYGTNYTFSDMDDAAKNLQAMMYFMVYQYERYGNDLGAALTAYNVGHYSGTVNGYAKKILGRV